ncbi:MAG TPA: DUF4235 domain-containing protein [Streptosporangiaceae bacterium]|jgi:hypothetical protein
MSGKSGVAGSKAVTALVGMAAAFAARKLIVFAGKKLTGKEPPEHPEDPRVALREALLWGLVIGAGVHTAKVLATRAAVARMSNSQDEPAG